MSALLVVGTPQSEEREEILEILADLPIEVARPDRLAGRAGGGRGRHPRSRRTPRKKAVELALRLNSLESLARTAAWWSGR